MTLGCPRLGWPQRLFLVTTLSHLTLAASRLLVSYRVLDLGGGARDIGLLLGLSAFVPLLVVLRAGRLVDRRHPAGMLVAGVVTSAVGLGLFAAGGHLAWLYAGSMVLGLGQLLTVVAAQAFIPHFAARDDIDRRFGGLTLAASVGQLVGLPLVGLMSHTDAVGTPARGLAAMAAISLAAVPATWGLWRVRGDERGPTPLTDVARVPTPVRALLVTPGMPAAMASSLAVLASLDLLTGYLPMLGEERGWSVTTVSLLLTTRAVASAVSRAFLSQLLRVSPRSALVLSATGCSAVAMAVVPFVPSSSLVYVAMAVTGVFWGIGQPLTMSWVVAIAPPADRGTALSLRLAGNRVGQVVVPAVVGGVASQAGVGAVFWCSGAMLASATVVAHRAFTND